MSTADGCLLEVHRHPHGPPAGLQVQRERDGLALSSPQPFNRGPGRRRGDEHAVAAYRSLVSWKI